MNSLAFGILAFMLGIYVLLDGFDLGVAAIAPLIGRNGAEREAAMRAIGPFWNGNEVWLIAAGGALFALFPKAYASAFSGFYLPFVIVLWLLMFRGIAMELRGHFATKVWRDFWDVAFTGSSALLVLLFGVALGNLIRGVPLDADGYFTGSFGFLLNPYALLVGATAVAALALHGATFAGMRIAGAPGDRAAALVPKLAAAALLGFLATSAATAAIRWHDLPAPWTALLPVVALGALGLAVRYALTRRARAAFAASSVFLAAVFASAAATLYPLLLPGFGGAKGIGIFDAAPSTAALVSAVAAVAVGVGIVCIYGTLVLLPQFREKVIVDLNP
ncbi:MAG TPA: cytochrome d ubiquinol oxidase subunit II [Candidatus Baltobacteraceae bacterium]|jgi:cytochrome d ubiquinol oxidase subunit II